ncbi:hypothetical protein TrRE_jg1092, partial [Triparma retinervis]
MSWFELSYSGPEGDGQSELEPICGLESLEVLRMNNNFLAGTLSPCLSSMTNLREVDLSWNRLDGLIPSAFFSGMQHLVTLNLSVNKFLGAIPDFSSNVNLVSLDLSLNAHEDRVTHLGFSGFMYDTQFPPSLRNVNLERNSIGGPIPSSLCDTETEVVDLSHNLLTGGLGHCFQGDVSSVRVLDFGKNLLNGTVPSFWSMFHLVSIDLSANELEGGFPTTAITSFHAYENAFTGPIPSSYLLWSSLVHLDVSYNRISGPLSPSWASLSTLESLYVANNYMDGPLPWYYSPGLREFDVSWNLFTGSLPSNMSASFQYFAFENNLLEGVVPYKIWTMPSLRVSYDYTGPNDVACPVGTSGDYGGKPFPDGVCVACHNETCAPYLAQSFCPIGCGHDSSQGAHDTEYEDDSNDGGGG